jgi:hypothetical protein
MNFPPAPTIFSAPDIFKRAFPASFFPENGFAVGR